MQETQVRSRLGRSPGEGNDNPLQYSCLENLMDGAAWLATVHGVAKNWTRLSDFTIYLCSGSCHLQTVRVLLLLFQFGFLLFLFSALIPVAKTSKTMLNSSGESGHPCLVPDVRGNAFNFSLLRIMFPVGLSYIAFIMLRYVPSIPAFWRVFIINGC